MLTYSTLQDRPREFLAATGLMHDEFARVLPAFAAAYAILYPPAKTWEGKARHRPGVGAPCLPKSWLADRVWHRPQRKPAAHAQTRRASGRSQPGTLAVCLVRSNR